MPTTTEPATVATPETSHADHAKATWARICEPIIGGGTFDKQQDTLIQITKLFEQFETLFSVDKALHGTAKASVVFAQIKQLADQLHENDKTLEAQHQYFVKLDTIWPAGLESRWFMGFLGKSKNMLEKLSTKYIAKDHQHPTVTNTTGYGFGLLRIFYNLLLIHGNFRIFHEVESELPSARSSFLKGLYSSTNIAKAQAEFESALLACQVYTDGKKAGKEDQQPTAAESTPSRNNSVGDIETELRVARVLLIIDKVHTYLQRRKEETATATLMSMFTGYSQADLDARQACFDGVIQEITNPDNRESHRRILQGFIRNAIHGFQASTRLSRQDFYDGMLTIAKALGSREFLLSDFRTATDLSSTTVCEQSITATADTEAHASATLRLGSSSGNE